MNKTNNIQDLDTLNNGRVEKTRKRVAHAIRLMDNPVGCLIDNRVIDTAVNDIAKAINILEAASEDMSYACAHFDWNSDICDLINQACGKAGLCLAMLDDPDEENRDIVLAGIEARDGMSMLAKALATLIRWNDDTFDVSEV